MLLMQPPFVSDTFIPACLEAKKPASLFDAVCTMSGHPKKVT